MSTDRAKALGAFYTSEQVASFLVSWAIQSPSDTVFDPSFGGGVFLYAACRRIAALGGIPQSQVLGIEIDPDAFSEVRTSLRREFGISNPKLTLGDFFAFDSKGAERVDAVVGNPPFIRYQRFSGKARQRALKQAANEGVSLSELSSSWAPFLIHSISRIRQGGRLAMVLPFEVGHASYAAPVLEHLKSSFGEVTLLTFRQRLFPELSEETVLLLARDKGLRCSHFLWRDMEDSSALSVTSQVGTVFDGGADCSAGKIIRVGEERLVEHFIPKRTRELYRELAGAERIRRLGDLAKVGIGYVTGANEFFHLTPEQARQWNIPDRFLRKAVRKGKALSGLRFTDYHWRAGTARGESGYLLAIPPRVSSLGAVKHYLDHGAALGVPSAYKCRTRPLWYSVPRVHSPDAFLTYMSGVFPKLVANDASAVAPNTLHLVRMRPLSGIHGKTLATHWQTSLTRLSVEIEGHALGGGMLKLEPGEAENVLLPLASGMNNDMEEFSKELENLMQSDRQEQAVELADRVILRDKIGLTEPECRSLRQGAEILQGRRYKKASSA